MVKEYAAHTFTLIQTTPNDPPGINKIYDAAVSAMTDIDNDVVELLDQRSKLVTIVRHYSELYRILQDEALRTSGEIEHIINIGNSPELQTMDQARRQVLQLVSRQEDGEVTADWILRRLREQIHVPWQNPKAAISTILLRSGRWKKKEKGVFIRVTEEAKE